MADISIVAAAVAPAPQDYTLPGAQELLLRAVGCTINGSAAAGAFIPALQLVDPAGHVMFTAANTSKPVAAGGTALVSWFPGGGVDNAGSGGGSSGGISSLASPTGTLLVGSPTGPAATVDMPVTGVGAGTYGDSLTVPQVTVDAEGRLTTVTNIGIASGAGGGIVQVSKVQVTSGDLTTSSTTFTDATGLTTTITTGAHRCLVFFSANAQNSGTNLNTAVDLAIDGTRQGQTYGLSIVQNAGSGGSPNAPIGFAYLTASLSAASHTFKIQFRTDGGVGAAKIFASTSVSPAILTVLELGV